MKEILLTQGRIAVVDDEDYEYISQYKWYYGGSGYAVRKSRNIFRKQELVYMHRVIAGAHSGDKIDHINGNKLCNIRYNLRVCMHHQNMSNRKLNKNNKSGYKGVSRDGTNKWRAQIKVNYKEIYLGTYDTAESAARVYDCAAQIHFGEFAKLNFPEG